MIDQDLSACHSKNSEAIDNIFLQPDDAVYVRVSFCQSFTILLYSQDYTPFGSGTISLSIYIYAYSQSNKSRRESQIKLR